jgi:hypothetical protein
MFVSSANGEAFSATAFGGRIRISELKHGVHTFGYKINFDTVDQRQVFVMDININAVDVEYLVITGGLVDPPSFILEPGATALSNRQADAYGSRVLVDLFPYMPDCTRRHGYGCV